MGARQLETDPGCPRLLTPEEFQEMWQNWAHSAMRRTGSLGIPPYPGAMLALQSSGREFREAYMLRTIGRITDQAAAEWLESESAKLQDYCIDQYVRKVVGRRMADQEYGW